MNPQNAIPEESWIVYRELYYRAVPWPFAKNWEAFLASPEPLVETCSDFGRMPACDGLSETPSVPAHLPRAAADGKHEMAVYHDDRWLYCFLKSQDGRVIVPDSRLDAIPRLATIPRSYPAMILFDHDGRWSYTFAIDGQGKPVARKSPALYSARKVAPATEAIEFEMKTLPADGGDITCWKVSRKSIADAFYGQKLKLSVCRLKLQTQEHVAWGTVATWGPRFDESGTVDLVNEKPARPWPTVRRIDLTYSPSTETGKLAIHWESPFEPGEYIETPYPDKRMIVHWDKCALRVNSARQVLPMGPVTHSEPFALRNGHNMIEVSSSGGLATRFTLEKRSGNHIEESAGEPVSPRGMDWIKDRIAQETRHWIKQCRERASDPNGRRYQHFEIFHSSAIGRAWQDVEPDPDFLVALRHEADYALSLQRPDGTFSGYHMSYLGKPIAHWAGGAFDSGQAGELWCVAADLLKDEKYVTASRRLLEAYEGYPVEFNHNFAAFSLYHFAAHYRLTGERQAIDRGLYYAKYLVSTDLTPMGFHGAHNYYGCYGSITLRGLALLWQVLPDDEPFKPILRERCIRMTNQAISRLQADGSFDSRDRYFVSANWWMWGFFPMVFMLDPKDLAALDRSIQKMLYAPVVAEKPDGRYVAYSDAIRYFKRREKLLAGEKFDMLSMV